MILATTTWALRLTPTCHPEPSLLDSFVLSSHWGRHCGERQVVGESCGQSEGSMVPLGQSS